MKIKSFLLLLTFGILISGCSNSDRDILSKTSKKLQKLKAVHYQTEIKNFNPYNGELGKTKLATYTFDFNSYDSIIGAKYLFSTDYGDEGFNGLTAFYAIKEKKQLVYDQADLRDVLFFPFSILQLRNLMPHILADTSFSFYRSSDTLINGTDCFNFEIILKGKSIDIDGMLVQSEGKSRYYKLMIDKKDYLPKQSIIYGSSKYPNWIVTYNDIDLSEIKNDSVFDYSLGYPDYIKYSREEYRTVVNNETILHGNAYLGSEAKDWTLPSMTGDSVRLSTVNSKLILLEFWFPYCSGCVAAVPEINDIQKKFKRRGLDVYGIEFTKPDSNGLADYISKMKIEYPTLYAAKNIAPDYGVSAGPTVFLINQNRKFVYAREGFIREEVVEAIEKNLK